MIFVNTPEQIEPSFRRMRATSPEVLSYPSGLGSHCLIYLETTEPPLTLEPLAGVISRLSEASRTTHRVSSRLSHPPLHVKGFGIGSRFQTSGSILPEDWRTTHRNSGSIQSKYSFWSNYHVSSRISDALTIFYHLK